MGAGLFAGSCSLSAGVTVEIDGQSFALPDSIVYRPGAIEEHRITIHSAYGWSGIEQGACDSVITKSQFEVRVFGPDVAEGEDPYTLLLPVAQANYDPASQTLQITTPDGNGAECVSEVLHFSRFESTDFAPSPGS